MKKIFYFNIIFLLFVYVYISDYTAAKYDAFEQITLKPQCQSILECTIKETKDTFFSLAL